MCQSPRPICLNSVERIGWHSNTPTGRSGRRRSDVRGTHLRYSRPNCSSIRSATSRRPGKEWSRVTVEHRVRMTSVGGLGVDARRLAHGTGCAGADSLSQAVQRSSRLLSRSVGQLGRTKSIAKPTQVVPNCRHIARQSARASARRGHPFAAASSTVRRATHSRSSYVARIAHHRLPDAAVRSASRRARHQLRSSIGTSSSSTSLFASSSSPLDRHRGSLVPPVWHHIQQVA